MRIFSLFDRLVPSDDPAPSGLLRRTLRNMILGTGGGATLAALLLAVPAGLAVIVLLYSLVFSTPVPLHDVLEGVLFGAKYIGWGALAGAAGGLVWNLAMGRLRYVTVGIASMSVFCFFIAFDGEGDPRSWDPWVWYGWALMSIAFGLAAAWGMMRAEAEDGV